MGKKRGARRPARGKGKGGKKEDEEPKETKPRLPVRFIDRSTALREIILRNLDADSAKIEALAQAAGIDLSAGSIRALMSQVKVTVKSVELVFGIDLTKETPVEE